MKEPTMTLREIRQAIEEQDRQLRAAHEELSRETGNRAIAPPFAALERLREMCAVEPLPTCATKPHDGIRC